MVLAKKLRLTQILGWVVGVVFVLLAVAAQHLLAAEAGPPWQILCWISIPVLVLLELDALALEVEVRIADDGEQPSARAAKAHLGGGFFRLWPFPLLPAAALSSAFFIGFGLRWGLGAMGYCALPLCVSFSAMLGAHVSLIRRLRRVPAAAACCPTWGVGPSPRRRRLYYGVIFLIFLPGIAFLCVAGKPWALRGMVRSAVVPGSFGIVVAFLMYRQGRRMLQATSDGDEAESAST